MFRKSATRLEIKAVKQGTDRKDRDEKHKTKETTELNKISGELQFDRLRVQIGADLDNTKVAKKEGEPQEGDGSKCGE